MPNNRKLMTVIRVDRRIDEALDQVEERTGADRATAARVLRDVHDEEGGPIDKGTIAMAVKRIKSLTQ